MDLDPVSLSCVIEADDEYPEEVIPYTDELKAALPRLLAQHRKLFVHPTACGLVVFIKASDVDHRAITAAKLGGREIGLVDNQVQCGWNSVVWPSRDAFAVMAEEYPGIPLMIGILAWSEAQGDRRRSKKKR